MRALAIWNEVLVLQVAGEIDLATIARLRERLHEHVPGAHQMVILDFTEVSFLGACGISLLVEIADQAHAAGQTFSPYPECVFDGCGVTVGDVPGVSITTRAA